MKRYISILLILAVITGYAEETFRFRHITMADGLSDNQINHITRDSQGFMWFSTQHGLNRYDGYRFKIFYDYPQKYPNFRTLSIVDLLK